MRDRKNPWVALALGIVDLGSEAMVVIDLRLRLLVVGGEAARAEAARMVGEKLAVSLMLPALAMSGRLGLSGVEIATESLAYVRRRVRANRRRLKRA